VFDPATVRDRSSFSDPHHYSDGIEYVMVNGKAVVDNGKLTGALPGKVLTR
jgi:N-acyl-D-amino-acid deacylase